MPPKKRKELAEDASPEGATAPKKAKKAAPTQKPLDPSVPINTTMPSPLVLPLKPADSTRISAYNVCGINAANKKGLRTYVEAEDPDIFVMTETKSEEKDANDYRYYGMGTQKGYAGTAILCKTKPLSITKGLPTLKGANTEGRCITVEYAEHYVVGTYVPNAGQGLKNMTDKLAWCDAFDTYLHQLDAVKPVIWCGDLNVAPSDKDIRNAKSNWNKTAGYTQQEIDAFERQLSPAADSGRKRFIEIWRHRNPDKVGHYTYYGWRADQREKGIGWRLDFFVISERLLDRVLDTQIRYEVVGPSDHVPISLDFHGAL